MAIHVLSSCAHRTSCAQVHELPQSHCGDNREGAIIIVMRKTFKLGELVAKFKCRSGADNLMIIKLLRPMLHSVDLILENVPMNTICTSFIPIFIHFGIKGASIFFAFIKI